MAKDFDNEMRGSLFNEENRTNDKAPVATGTVTISGLEMRIVMWSPKIAGGTGKGAGKKFWPLSLEYRQGTKHVLAKVSPANIVVTGAMASPDGSGAGGAATAQASEDMPF